MSRNRPKVERSWPDIQDAVSKASSTYATVRRALVDMRQVDRTERQDIELDYLVVLGCKKLLLQLAEVVRLVGSRSVQSEFVKQAALDMPMPGPGVVGVEREPSMVSWPDNLYELALNEADAGWINTGGRSGNPRVGLEYADRKMSDLEGDALSAKDPGRVGTFAMSLVIEGVPTIMSMARWTKGADFVWEMLQTRPWVHLGRQ